MRTKQALDGILIYNMKSGICMAKHSAPHIPCMNMGGISLIPSILNDL